jgi:hypothetical protein
MNQKPTLLTLILFLAFAATSASAFYDPGTQRWLNRDPLGAQMPQIWQIWGTQLQLEEEESANLHVSLDNNPITVFDPYGLLVPRPRPARPCTRGVGIGALVGICLEVICDTHRLTKNTECKQRCHDTAVAGEDNCRKKRTREARRKCWEQLYEDLANCIRDCNRKYPE